MDIDCVSCAASEKKRAVIWMKVGIVEWDRQSHGVSAEQTTLIERLGVRVGGLAVVSVDLQKRRDVVRDVPVTKSIDNMSLDRSTNRIVVLQQQAITANEVKDIVTGLTNRNRRQSTIGTKLERISLCIRKVVQAKGEQRCTTKNSVAR